MVDTGGISVMPFLLVALFTALSIFAAVLAVFFVSALYGIRMPQAKEKGKTLRQIPLESVPPSGSFRESAQKAIIRCGRIPPSTGERFATTGYTDCRTRNSLFGGNLVCASGCLGLGTCAISCPSDAIVLRDGLAYVNDACNGCGICVDICPKGLISMVPVTLKECFDCAAKGHSESTIDCPIAREDCKIDLRNFPESGFKLLSRWGILKAKSR